MKYWVDYIKRKVATGYLVLPYSILAVSILFTAAVAGFMSLSYQNNLRYLAQSQNQIVRKAIESRMKNYEQILRGGVGLINTSANLNADIWSDYVSKLNLPSSYPGLRSLSYAPWIKVNEKEYFVNSMRATGIIDYQINPSGIREAYTPVQYTATNESQRVLGFDMYSEPSRKIAIDRARESGEAVITDRVILKGDAAGASPSILMYLPVYKKNADISSPDSRSKNILGFVVGTCRLEEMLKDILGQNEDVVGLNLYSNLGNNQTVNLYSSIDDDTNYDARFIQNFSVLNGTFGLEVFVKKGLLQAPNLTTQALIVGFGFSGLVFCIFFLLSSSRRNLQNQATAINSLFEESLIWKQALLDNNEYAIIATDTNGIIQTYNPNAQKMLQYSPGEIIGKQSPLIFHSPVELTQKNNYLSRKYNTKVVPGFETFKFIARLDDEKIDQPWTYFRKDGTTLQILLSVSTVMDPNGKVLGYMGLAKDNTKNLLYQKKLQNNKRKLEHDKAIDEAILENIGEGMIVTDNHGFISYANPAALKMFERELNQIKNKQWGVDIPKIYKNEGELIQNYAQTASAISILTKHKSIVYETFQIGEGNTFVQVIVTTTPLLFKGKSYGSIIIFRDVSREMEIDKIKTEFVTVASHQLRTPLTALNWYTEDLLEDKTLSVEQRTKITQLYQSTQNMTGLVNALLNVSKLDMGNFVINPEPTDLVDLIGQITTELDSRIVEKNMVLSLRYPKRLPKPNLDKQMMYIVIQNLLTNAIKYTPKSGKISVQIRLAKSDILIDVKDSGYGIPAKDHPKVFSKLFRADNILKRETDGNGLGLYITKTILNRMGCEIEFESKENQGTTFHIKIPIQGVRLANPKQK